MWLGFLERVCASRDLRSRSLLLLNGLTQLFYCILLKMFGYVRIERDVGFIRLRCTASAQMKVAFGEKEGI